MKAHSLKAIHPKPAQRFSRNSEKFAMCRQESVCDEVHFFIVIRDESFSVSYDCYKAVYEN